VAVSNTPEPSDVSLPRAPLGRFASFSTVGIIGFGIDASILSTLVHIFAWPHYTARALSFAAAVTGTWYLNRRWVFRRTPNLAREYASYFGIQAAGACINLGAYAVAIAVVPALARLPVVPLAAGASLALLFNYSAANRWVFAATAHDARPPR
jgi:putative flippase GtrA